MSPGLHWTGLRPVQATEASLIMASGHPIKAAPEASFPLPPHPAFKLGSGNNTLYSRLIFILCWLIIKCSQYSQYLIFNMNIWHFPEVSELGLSMISLLECCLSGLLTAGWIDWYYWVFLLATIFVFRLKRRNKATLEVTLIVFWSQLEKFIERHDLISYSSPRCKGHGIRTK